MISTPAPRSSRTPQEQETHGDIPHSIQRDRAADVVTDARPTRPRRSPDSVGPCHSLRKTEGLLLQEITDTFAPPWDTSSGSTDRPARSSASRAAGTAVPSVVRVAGTMSPWSPDVGCSMPWMPAWPSTRSASPEGPQVSALTRRPLHGRAPRGTFDAVPAWRGSLACSTLTPAGPAYIAMLPLRSMTLSAAPPVPSFMPLPSGQGSDRRGLSPASRLGPAPSTSATTSATNSSEMVRRSQGPARRWSLGPADGARPDGLTPRSAAR